MTPIKNIREIKVGDYFFEGTYPSVLYPSVFECIAVSSGNNNFYEITGRCIGNINLGISWDDLLSHGVLIIFNCGVKSNLTSYGTELIKLGATEFEWFNNLERLVSEVNNTRE